MSPQAEAIAKGAVRVQQSALATKEDIAELKTDIAGLEAATKADIGLLRWMAGFNPALTAAVLLALIFS